MSQQPHVRSRRRRISALLAVVLSGALALSACQSAVNQSDEESSKPQRGGTLTVVQSADVAPSTFLSQNNPNFAIMRTVFNTLTTYDHDTLEPQPELATDWTLAPDEKSLTLQLRDDVTFHSGRAFTADDVVFTVEAMQREDVPSQLKHVALAVTDMKVKDEHELTLVLDHPMSNLFDMLELMPIVDSETFDQLLTGEEIIGTGPFKVEKYTPGTGVELVRNDDYWVEDRPYLDGIDIEVQTQSQSMLSSLRSGQAQLALDLAPLDTVSLKGNPDFENIESDADDAVYYVASNVTVKPLDDPDVRRGIAYAIDRDRILEQALGGIGRTSSLPWAESSPAYDETGADTYAYDKDKAKDLISGAGADGAKVPVVFNAGFPTNQAIAEIVQFNLKEAGLDAELEPLQAADFFARLGTGDLPGLFVNVHGFGQLQPATLVKGAFPFNADGNASNFDSDEYRGLADGIWKASGEDADADDAYGRLNDFLLEQQFVSDLVVSSHTFTTSTSLQGVEYTMFDYLDLDDAYLTK